MHRPRLKSSVCHRNKSKLPIIIKKVFSVQCYSNSKRLRMVVFLWMFEDGVLPVVAVTPQKKKKVIKTASFRVVCERAMSRMSKATPHNNT